ncbi:alanine racemase [Fructobacillus sp. M2-14]|uniref:Alanine racemase n=1 Tax=Fructobacillus broussonetiae TaxID=2713173 RepID=A0ABS5R0Y6_9LACO|nr:alanine racemase [Fructobacillus broussonetiae]MBS9338570.1 alanine racemase [Fructobacillus broussonetiae]
MTRTSAALKRRGLAFFRSKKALVHNAKAVMEVANAKRLIAVVKANAYGYGDTWAAKTLNQELGVKDFAVATLDEGVRVRSALPDDCDVILLGVQPAFLADEMAEKNLSPVAGSFDWLLAAKKAIDEKDKKLPALKIHLAVDTGMGRLGAKTRAELASMYNFVCAEDCFELAGVMTHFATADEDNQPYYDQQLADFMAMVKGLDIPEKYCHVANSGSALYHHDEVPTDTIRVGSVLYGYNPALPDRPSPIELEPVGSLVGQIWGVHRLLKGESLSYGATYTANEDQWVGTIPVGYADGLKRTLSGMTVLVNEQEEKILGRVTMDQIIISLREPVAVGSEVTFIGKDQEKEIKIEDVAEYGDTIPHELLTGISSRVPRVDVD